MGLLPTQAGRAIYAKGNQDWGVASMLDSSENSGGGNEGESGPIAEHQVNTRGGNAAVSGGDLEGPW